MHRLLCVALWFAAVAGCGEGCSCSFVGGDEESAAGQGAATQTEPFGELPPSADPGEQAKLVRAQEDLLRRPQQHAAPAKVDALVRLAPSKLGAFAAAGEPVEGPSEMFGKPIATVSRRYADGERAAYVKITDTATAPQLREPFAKRLTRVAGPEQGREHGGFVGEHPALLSHYPKHRSSSVTFLVDGRYLVDVRVQRGTSATDALELAKGLDFSSLEGSAGQGG